MQSPHAAREHVLKFIRRTIQHESAAVEVLDSPSPGGSLAWRSSIATVTSRPVVTVRSSAASGEVRAGTTEGFTVFRMPARRGSGEEVLSGVSHPSFFLDLRALPDGSELKDWLAARHSFYDVGAQWNESTPEANTGVFSLLASFDGLVSFREGHASGEP